jgi:hypothetical protein
MKYLSIAVFILLFTSCVPDDSLDHPCQEGSSVLNDCEPVAPGGACAHDNNCLGTMAKCIENICVCDLDCRYRDCGDDGCGGSCGDCESCLDCIEGNCGSPLETWCDLETVLLWQNPPSSGELEWAAAKLHCDSLVHAGFSDWRLPTINELRTLIRGCPHTAFGGACGVTDQCLEWSCSDKDSGECEDINCGSNEGPAGGCYWLQEMEGNCDVWYWSSSIVKEMHDLDWVVNYFTGVVSVGNFDADRQTRCVRDAP